MSLYGLRFDFRDLNTRQLVAKIDAFHELFGYKPIVKVVVGGADSSVVIKRVGVTFLDVVDGSRVSISKDQVIDVTLESPSLY